MMTGLRAEQTGIVGNDTPLRDKLPDIVTLPQLCKAAGWQAHAFGKLKPHDPFIAPKKYFDLYPPGSLKRSSSPRPVPGGNG